MASPGADRRVCAHCGQPLRLADGRPSGGDDGTSRYCCAGCAAAAAWLDVAGASTSAPGCCVAPTATAPRADRSESTSRAGLHAPTDPDARRLVLLVEGMHCASCVGLIEQALGALEGVQSVRVALPLKRVEIHFDPARTQAPRLIARIEALGFKTTRPGAGSERSTVERRQALARLALAGLGTMQAMMFAEPLYWGAEGLQPATRDFFRWITFLVATPVLFYSGMPILRGAWIELRQRRPGMDLPIALALLLGYGASVWVTLTGGREVYFDAVAMFIFFLGIGRYCEARARERARNTIELLQASGDEWAWRVVGERVEPVLVSALAVDDELRVRQGESVPADGVLLDAAAELDESLLTGESRPVLKRRGDPLYAGSSPIAAPLRLRVVRRAQDSLRARLIRLMEQAQLERPPWARRLEGSAARMSFGLLLLWAVVSALWWWYDPERSLAISLSVLAVACPCAIALALPAALAAAYARLAGAGVLLTRSEALENLARCTLVVFDKTGTLTRGRPTLRQSWLAPDRSTREVLGYAAALERAVHHPLAAAFVADDPPTVDAARVEPGRGVRGSIDGVEYRIGRADYVAELGAKPTVPALPEEAIHLGRSGEWLAAFTVEDELRADASIAVAALLARGMRPHILSGDAEAAVRRVAERLAIAGYDARLSPDQKLARIRQWQAEGQTVLMVGDGSNDAPGLAAADVSVALGAGSALAQRAAHVVLLRDELAQLPAAIDLAHRYRRIVRQNLLWALGYNLVGILAASLGYVPAWLAAIGMSASSLLVTLNALRLAPATPPRARGHADPIPPTNPAARGGSHCPAVSLSPEGASR